MAENIFGDNWFQVRLVLNCVTRRYATIIMTSAPDILRSGKANVWGYTVDSVIFWRPPQANISKSYYIIIAASIQISAWNLLP